MPKNSEETIPLLLKPSGSTKAYHDLIEQQEQQPKLRYPIGVVFVLMTKFFEALAANGIRTILALYLRDDLNFTESLSTVMLHVFNFFGQFCPIFGAILADSYTGNIRAITYFYILYAIGWIGLIITSFPLQGLPVTSLISLSLLFLSVGNGSIRACITSLGASQFRVPQQSSSLNSYFSHYYFAYYLGIFLSKILPPYVRANSKCFGKTDCYPAVFITLGLAFLCSWVLFLLGKFFYKREFLKEENIIVKFYQCVQYALISKYRNGREIKKKHWLDYSEDQYSREFLYNAKTFLKVLKLFIPLPIYYALLAQQDSTWTFQATQLNTTIFNRITIEPDQAKAMGPIFLFSFIPLWEYVCIPIMNRFHITFHPLHSVAVGGICSALSFICSGILQIAIENEKTTKSFNILWQIPQFILLMMGELFLSIPGLQFAFTQAPASMKSALTAAWFLNNAFGNLIVVFMTEFIYFELQSILYFIYSIMMFISMIIFTIMACNYLIDPHHSENYEEI